MRQLSAIEFAAVAGGFAPPGGLPEPPSTPRGGGPGLAGLIAALGTIAWELYTNWDKISGDAQSFYRWLTGADMDFDNCYYTSSGCGAPETMLQTYWDDINPDSPIRRNPWDLDL